MTTTINGKKGKVEINTTGEVEIIDNKYNSQYIIKNHTQGDSYNTFVFTKGSGKDTITSSNDKDDIIFTDDKAENIHFTNDGKGTNLVIKKNNNKDTITLVDYFNSDTEKLNKITDSTETESTITDKYIEITGKNEIQGIQLSTYKSDIKGSNKNDTIKAGLGVNKIEARKGNDTISFQNQYDVENVINIKKGDGNDTIVFNYDGGTKDLQGLLYGLPEIYFESDVEFSYAKEKNDLIITASHDLKNKSKETVRIDGYFWDDTAVNPENNYSIKEYVDDGIELKKGFDTVKETVTLGETSITSSPLTINGITERDFYFDSKKSKDVYIYQGSVYDDSFIGSNKSDIMNSYDGDNEFITGKSGGTIINSNGTSSEDTYIVSSASNGTFIKDAGGTEDSLQINGMNKNDIHMFVDADTSENPNIIGYINTSGINALKNLKYDTVQNVTKTAKGVFDVNGGMDTVTFADSKGIIAKEVAMTDVDRNKTNLKTDINSYINYLKDEYDLNYTSALEILQDNGKNITDKTKKSVLKAVQKDLTNLYKNTYLGTYDDNSYTLKQGNHYIGSGYGSDKFNFSGKLGYTDAKGETDHRSVIKSSSDVGEKDTIQIKNYSFEKGTLSQSYDFASGNFSLTAVDIDKTGIVYTQDISYTNTDILNASENKLSIIDKNRTYSLTATTNGYNTNWYSDESKINHITYIKSTSDADIKSNKGYNEITLLKADGVDEEHPTEFGYEYNGGHDRVNSLSEYCDDQYKVYFTSSTDLIIKDAGGTDSLNITNAKGNLNLKNLRLMVNLSDYNELTHLCEVGSYSLVDKSNLKASNVNINATTEEFNSKKGLTVNGDIETIQISNTEIEINNWINHLNESISGWLHANRYDSTADVFENGSNADIKTLISFYNISYEDLPIA